MSEILFHFLLCPSLLVSFSGLLAPSSGRNSHQLFLSYVPLAERESSLVWYRDPEGLASSWASWSSAPTIAEPREAAVTGCPGSLAPLTSQSKWGWLLHGEEILPDTCYTAAAPSLNMRCTPYDITSCVPVTIQPSSTVPSPLFLLTHNHVCFTIHLFFVLPVVIISLHLMSGLPFSNPPFSKLWVPVDFLIINMRQGLTTCEMGQGFRNSLSSAGTVSQ